ncbi:MAG: hypothetical protein LBK12_05145 [Odoribacteraceae bacterium]|nr:hypothetical protein [Odoribacteraceae bacterium]
MIRNMDKKHTGDVFMTVDSTAETATGTFDSRKARALLLTRCSIEAAPGEKTVKQKNK